MHQRRIIRNGVADMLRDAGTAAEDRVFAGREAPAAVESLLEEGPIVLVYARTDRVKREDYPASGIDGGVKRTLEIAVEVTAAGAWTVDDKLDDLAEQIETLLESWEPEGLPATEIRLVSTEVDSSDEFEQPIGGALILFEADYWRPYRTQPDDPICPDAFAIINGQPAELVASDSES